jgi:AraC-like DNA-binding protein
VSNPVPLERYEIVGDEGRDALVSAICDAFTDARIETQPRVEGHVHHAPVGSVAFNVVCFTKRLAADPGSNLDFFAEHFCTHKSARIEQAGREFVCAADHGVVISPELRTKVRIDADAELHVVKIDRERLEERLRLMLGSRLAAPLEFEPAVDLSAQPARSRHRLIRFMIDELEQRSPMLGSPLVVANLQDALLASYLELAPHSYSERLRALRTPASRRQVREAESFIEAHPEQPIDVATLVHLTGTSGSSLYQAFKKERGYTPITFLRETRLRRVREDLCQAGPTTTVTDVALRWGFAHLGRFSAQYRELFAENPSETLRRAKRRVS